VNRFFAFLRGINVGGHNVKMDRIRAEVEALDVTDVSTFIASGNVVLTSETDDVTILERQIEQQLRDALGYDVVTLVRSAAEVARIAAQEPFADVDAREKAALYVGFLRRKLSAAERRAVMAWESDTDHLHVDGRELYWLPTTTMSDSPITGPRLEKALGQPTTLRNVNTVRRLAAKLS